MPNMIRAGSDESGLRVRCPGEDFTCEWEVLEKDWIHQPVTDHRCPDGHWFRIEGTDSDNLSNFQLYEINPEDAEFENFR